MPILKCTLYALRTAYAITVGARAHQNSAAYFDEYGFTRLETGRDPS